MVYVMCSYLSQVNNPLHITLQNCRLKPGPLRVHIIYVWYIKLWAG
jgi:hypothetical protein